MQRRVALGWEGVRLDIWWWLISRSKFGSGCVEKVTRRGLSSNNYSPKLSRPTPQRQERVDVRLFPFFTILHNWGEHLEMRGIRTRSGDWIKSKGNPRTRLMPILFSIRERGLAILFSIWERGLAILLGHFHQHLCLFIIAYLQYWKSTVQHHHQGFSWTSWWCGKQLILPTHYDFNISIFPWRWWQPLGWWGWLWWRRSKVTTFLIYSLFSGFYYLFVVSKATWPIILQTLPSHMLMIGMIKMHHHLHHDEGLVPLFIFFTAITIIVIKSTMLDMDHQLALWGVMWDHDHFGRIIPSMKKQHKMWAHVLWATVLKG